MKLVIDLSFTFKHFPFAVGATDHLHGKCIVWIEEVYYQSVCPIVHYYDFNFQGSIHSLLPVLTLNAALNDLQVK